MSLRAEDGLWLLLTAATNVSGIIATRLFAVGNVPSAVAKLKGSSPYGVVQVISNTHTHDCSGAVGIATAAVQVKWYCETELGLQSLMDASRLATDGYSGTVTQGSESIKVFSCLLENEIDVTQMPDDGSEFGSPSGLQEWMIAYQESTPSFDEEE